MAHVMEAIINHDVTANGAEGASLLVVIKREQDVAITFHILFDNVHGSRINRLMRAVSRLIVDPLLVCVTSIKYRLNKFVSGMDFKTSSGRLRKSSNLDSSNDAHLVASDFLENDREIECPYLRIWTRHFPANLWMLAIIFIPVCTEIAQKGQGTVNDGGDYRCSKMAKADLQFFTTVFFHHWLDSRSK
ncbi:MAG: hypothetical protein HWE34_18780 [Methylocystaceae bacterium]|nr:hypothetical protein [Methylocystaceae bacterium]